MSNLKTKDGRKFQGRRWKVVVNGQNSLNSKTYSVTFTGDIESIRDWNTIYDVIHKIADYTEENNNVMNFPDSIQVTLYPAKKYIKKYIK